MAKEDYKGIWIFAEQQNGVLNPVTLELLAKAQELKAHNGEDIYAILLGSDVKALAPTLIAHGADKVIVAEDAALASYSARPYQQAMTQLAEKYKPSIILYGATSLGRDFAPRVMVSLKTGLTADAIDLGYDEDDVFYQTTPAYGGSILAHIVILECRPQMATVRPKMFVPLEADESRKGEVRAQCYDMVLNGCELGGGSIRINDPAVQDRMLKALGFSEERARESFGFLMDAYQYGAPPHGGMAFGFDRMVMLMLKRDSIRDVIAFPKVQNAGEPMSGCPETVEEKQLRELSIAYAPIETEE